MSSSSHPGKRRFAFARARRREHPAHAREQYGEACCASPVQRRPGHWNAEAHAAPSARQSGSGEGQAVALQMPFTRRLSVLYDLYWRLYEGFVPERREERTTEGGLDAAGQFDHLAYFVDKLGAAGIRVSLFIEPSEAQVVAFVAAKARDAASLW